MAESFMIRMSCRSGMSQAAIMDQAFAMAAISRRVDDRRYPNVVLTLKM